MYYRRKVLLSLIETFGGKLQRTDCQKLLFLFCQHAKKNHYDFYPHKFGAFSSLAYQDKLRLTDLGYLLDGPDFQLDSPGTFVDRIIPKDRSLLNMMKSKYADMRGKALIRHVYLNYPNYTCRSEIASEMLSPAEQETIRSTWNTDLSPCLFTIGYEGLTIDAYLNKLISNNIVILVDVRNNPHSMKHGFSKTKFRQYLENVNIKYSHMPELGIPSDLRQDLHDVNSYQRLFNEYNDRILADQGDTIKKLRILAFENKRIALTCFEANYQFCHRHKIAEHLTSISDFNLPIVHL
jgi:uncharacterized protein (DUF488 family)